MQSLQQKQEEEEEVVVAFCCSLHLLSCCCCSATDSLNMSVYLYPNSSQEIKILHTITAMRVEPQHDPGDISMEELKPQRWERENKTMGTKHVWSISMHKSDSYIRTHLFERDKRDSAMKHWRLFMISQLCSIICSHFKRIRQINGE